MPKLIVTTREGRQQEIDAPVEGPSMEAIRAAGIDELVALCGGCCSCATHPVDVNADFIDRLPPMTEDEEDLLGSSSHRLPVSRLSCQLPVDADLDGLRPAIAPGIRR